MACVDNGRELATTVVERNPAYETWESERAALIVRAGELVSELEACDPDAPHQAFLAAQRDGLDEESCHESANAVSAKYEALRDESRQVNIRLALIKPHVHREKMEVSRRGDARDEYRDRLFGYLERIVAAVENMAAKQSKRPKSKGKSVGA